MFTFCLNGPEVRAYWAAEITLIPDFISRRSERRKMDVAAAIQAALAVQRGWVDRLCNGDKRSTLSMRYVSSFDNAEPQIRLGFVGQTKASNELEARTGAEAVWDSFRGTFPDSDYPLVPSQNIREFTRLFLPFYPHEFAEVRRYEEIASLVEAYLPSPYSVTSDADMQARCQALLSTETPHLIAVNITPTSLTGDERNLLANEVRRLGELKQRSVQSSVQAVGYGVTVQKVLAEAELAENTLRDLSMSLRQSFEMTVTVASKQRLSMGVLRALTAEATRQDTEGASKTLLGPRAVIATPHSINEKLVALRNLIDLNTNHWGSQLAPAGLERVPRLFSSAEAHAVFRLPIPDDEGVYGIPCSAFNGGTAAGKRKSLRPLKTLEPSANEIPIGSVNLSHNTLTQHLLVVGVPGTGKTNTCLTLLQHLWDSGSCNRVPFLVLEPAKFEYRGLLHTPGISEHLQIFSAGDERIAPFRFNPFAVPRGISLEAHVGKLIDIFRASMAMWGPLPAILERLIRRLYRTRGWLYVSDDVEREAPQMIDLYDSIRPGIKELGYSRETESEATAALEVRVGRLCDGSLGKMLNARASVDFDAMMQHPVVIEIGGIGNSDDRAFVMALILNRIYQYWIVRKDQSSQGLKHVTLVEEAHNLLGNVDTAQIEGQANPKGEAVQQFANMLAEIRSFGEGLIIADQSPSKLIPDVVRMTGTKIRGRPSRPQIQHESD
jgi:hypothetical protein